MVWGGAQGQVGEKGRVELGLRGKTVEFLSKGKEGQVRVGEKGRVESWVGGREGR